jgi:8-oxo-dGTP diphosphatase
MVEVVCGVIKDSEGLVMACRRGKGRHLAGFWEFPGGKVDAGESAEFALQRELMEELGVAVEVGGKFQAVVEWTDGKVAIRLSAYWCKISEGTPTALEHSELRWCSAAELGELELAEADVPLLLEIRDQSMHALAEALAGRKGGICRRLPGD